MAEERQQRPLHELLTPSFVSLTIGPEKTSYTLHEELLCAHSQYFNETFHSASKDADDAPSSSAASEAEPDAIRNDQNSFRSGSEQPPKSLALPDEENESFKLFVAWLYAQHLPSPQSENDLTPLLDLCLLAEKYGIPALEAQALRLIRGFYRGDGTYPSLRRVQYVRAGAEKDSALKRFVMGCSARMFLEKGVKEHWRKAVGRDGALALEVLEAVAELCLGVMNELGDPRLEREVGGKMAGSAKRDGGKGGESDVVGDDESQRTLAEA